MKRFIPFIIFFSLILGACSPAGGSVDTSTPKPSATATKTPTPTKTSAPTNTPAPEREAALSEIENTVSAQIKADEELVPAQDGMVISAGGGVETGDDGRARLDLLPDGTIVRVGPNSSFTLLDLGYEEGEPKTVIELLFGSIYILLNGGSLDVETPSGVASVRGSLLNVDYDPETGYLSATCLEGHCGLKNEENNEVVELVEGEKSYIEFRGQKPAGPRPMNQNDVQRWLDHAPEIKDFLSKLPNPKDFPPPQDGERILPPWKNNDRTPIAPRGTPKPGNKQQPRPGGNLPPLPKPPNDRSGPLPPP